MSNPATRYSFRVGDKVIVRGWPASTAMEVIDTSDQALLILQIPSGATLKVGRRACVLVQTGNTTQETSP